MIVVVLLVGVLSAAQIGKMAIAASAVQADLSLSLVSVSAVTGSYAILGATFGMAIGALVGRSSLHRMIIGGLLMLAAGNLIGAVSPGAGLLLSGRITEGLGFVMLSVSAPALLRGLTSDRNRPLVLAMWSAYIPFGAALMLLIGPTFMQGNWRTLWLVNAGGAFALALIVWLCLSPARGVPKPGALPAEPGRGSLRHPVLWLLALIFFMYSTQYFMLASFMPLFLTRQLGLSLQDAGTWSAFLLFANAGGNIVGGLLMRRGWAVERVLVIGFLAIGICGGGIFVAGVPTWVTGGLAAACLALAAFLPAAIIVKVSGLARQPSEMALFTGLIQQSSAAGQLVGSILIAAWVDAFDWPAAAWLFCAIGAIGLALAGLVRAKSAPARI